jgi:hypothetical protein
MTDDYAPLTALKNARAWVRHWQRDSECNLLPTPESLRKAEIDITIAIELLKKKEMP